MEMLFRKLKRIFFKFFIFIDEKLKFPNLQNGHIAIQVGFDMSAPLTSDLFELWNRVKPGGQVIGIDPDPENHQIAIPIIQRKSANILLIEKATYSEKTKSKLQLGRLASWNQLSNIPIDQTVEFSGRLLEVETDTIDGLIHQLGIDPADISHVNITNNGAEYHTLLGMKKLLANTKGLSLTIIAGRQDDSGIINGKADIDLITELLKKYDFSIRFKRINQLFWWAVIVKLIINRQWVFGKKNYGVVMAAKGNKKLPWYQSFS